MGFWLVLNYVTMEIIQMAKAVKALVMEKCSAGTAQPLEEIQLTLELLFRMMEFMWQEKKVETMEILIMEMAEVILGLLRMDLLAQMIFFREVLVY